MTRANSPPAGADAGQKKQHGETAVLLVDRRKDPVIGKSYFLLFFFAAFFAGFFFALAMVFLVWVVPS